MLHYISVSFAIAIFLSPLPMVGKILDFHFTGKLKNTTLDGLESAYIHCAYGTLLQEYAEGVQRTMRGKWVYSIFIIFGLTILSWIWIELYLFRRVYLSSYLTRNYFRMLPALLFLGVADYFATYLVAKQAARGRTALALLLALVAAYTSLVLSESVLATFFMPMKQTMAFFFDFFLNRMLNVSKSMILGGWTVRSEAYGTKVSALAFALPPAVVSSFFLVSALTLGALSTKFMQPIVNYFAKRILRPDEKAIHYKLCVLLMIVLSLIIGLIICTVSDA
jgi:hypothetical protein